VQFLERRSTAGSGANVLPTGVAGRDGHWLAMIARVNDSMTRAGPAVAVQGKVKKPSKIIELSLTNRDNKPHMITFT
jgi:hypothetical protein